MRSRFRKTAGDWIQRIIIYRVRHETGVEMSANGFFKFMNKYSIYVILLVLFGIGCTLNENFYTRANIMNVSRQISITTIIAMAETILIIAGMIDLAAGAVLALAGVLSVATYVSTQSLPLALAVGAVVGVFCNSLSGLVVVKFKTPPFIATLAMQTAARGAALLYTNGQNIYKIGQYTVFGQGYISPIPTPAAVMLIVAVITWCILRHTRLGQGAIAIPVCLTVAAAGVVWLLLRLTGHDMDTFQIPTPVVFMIVIVVFTWYILGQTRFGRHLYAVGGNEDAARASGVSIGGTKFIAYAISGVFVGLAGVLYMSRNNAGLPNAGAGLEFDGMTAAIIGGTSFSGGVGTAFGTLAGGLFIGFLNNIMNLQGVHAYTQQIVRGGIIVLAVIWDVYSKQGRYTSGKKPEEKKTA